MYLSLAPLEYLCTHLCPVVCRFVSLFYISSNFYLLYASLRHVWYSHYFTFHIYFTYYIYIDNFRFEPSIVFPVEMSLTPSCLCLCTFLFYWFRFSSIALSIRMAVGDWCVVRSCRQFKFLYFFSASQVGPIHSIISLMDVNQRCLKVYW